MRKEGNGSAVPGVCLWPSFRSKNESLGLSLNDDNSAPGQGSGYEIRPFGEKQTYGFGIRGKDCMETNGNLGLEPLFLVCFDPAHSCLGDMIFLMERRKC